MADAETSLAQDFHTVTAMLIEEIGQTLAAVDPAALAALRRAIRQTPRIFIAGKGRTGLVMQAFAMRLMQMGYRVHVAGEATAPGIASGDLLVIGSGSGRTASLVGYAALAKQAGAQVAVLVAAPEAPLPEAADLVVRLPAPTKSGDGARPLPSIAPLGTRFEASLGLLLDVLVVQLMRESGLSEASLRARHANLE
jgi:6-phospho-3-hexuloisomerase